LPSKYKNRYLNIYQQTVKFPKKKDRQIIHPNYFFSKSAFYLTNTFIKILDNKFVKRHAVLAVASFGKKNCLWKQLSMHREIPPKTLVLNGIISKVCVGIVGNNHLIQLSPTIFQAFKIIYA